MRMSLNKNKIKFKQIIKLSHNIYIGYTRMLQINPSRLAKHACAYASKGLKILPALAFRKEKEKEN